MVGLPYDGTTSNRPGTRFGPAATREASWGLETYSPIWNVDLEDEGRFYDAGELDIPIGNREACLEVMRQACSDVLDANKHWLGVGGEHLVTYPAFSEVVKRYPDLGLLHFDAHADLRDDYLGETLSHATVLRRCVEQINPEHFVQIGIRSGPRDEWNWMRSHNTLCTSIDAAPVYRKRLEGRPVYLTIDLDCLDPSVLPGTGTPEPGGLTYNELLSYLQAFSGLNIVAADVVELSPHYDPTGVSSVVAAKVVRDVLMMVGVQP